MSEEKEKASPERKRYEEWELKAPYSKRTILIVAVILIALGFSAHNVEMDKMVRMIGQYFGYLVGIEEESQVANGVDRLTESMFPIQISESTPTARIENFDPENLPFLSRIDKRETKDVELDPETMELVETVSHEEVLVEPVGYLLKVLVKMWETLEIGLWGTLLAVIVSIPLAIWSARNYSWNKLTYVSARSSVSFLRAIPEMISALFLVLAFNFGPIAGILALGLHCAGFLGKFYAEDIENADRGPQDALQAIGASKIKVLWVAVIPQVFPQYIAYTLYILDRNVRMATVIGIVGAGGIGQELKGRYDMFNYAHVATILLVLFITVLTLDQISARLRAQLLK